MKYREITKDEVRELLLKAQHHSGLPVNSPSSFKFFPVLEGTRVTEGSIPMILDEMLNSYMVAVHEMYRKNKIWKSYDW